MFKLGAQLPNVTSGSLDTLLKKMENLIPNIVLALIVFIIGFFLIKFVMGLIKRVIKKSKKVLDLRIHGFLFGFVKGLLYAILITICAALLGVNTSSLVAILGVAGLAFSLAVKDSLSNVAGGLSVLTSKPFDVGDYVQVDGDEGTVHDIGLIYTVLTTLDNKKIYMPNGHVSNSVIINYSTETNRRKEFIFYISHQTDIDHAIEIVKEVVNKNPYVVLDPAPLIGISQHEPRGLQLTCKIWFDAQYINEFTFSIYEEVKKAFDREGIVIPYDQIQIHTSK